MSTPATQPVKTKSKAYSSTVAIQGDAAKYRQKYKELKRKTREIEVENDKLHLKTLRIKRNIQRMRLERAILYERLDSESHDAGAVYGRNNGQVAYGSPPSIGRDTIGGRRDDPYAMPDAARTEYASYHPAVSRPRVAPPHASDPRSGPAMVPPVASASGVTAPSYDRVERLPYPYERDYPPPPPLQSLSRPYKAGQYDARPHSPPSQALAPTVPTSTGERAERLRQYTPSASPEPHAPGQLVDSDPNSRSGMKVTLRRGA